MTIAEITLLSLTWAIYFLLHSLLASLWLKKAVERKLPNLLPWYRLLYNTFALLALIPPVALLVMWQGPLIWQYGGVFYPLVNAIALLAVLLLVWSLGFYDSGEFLGTRQLREKRRKAEDLETLKISTLHRFVRHPWYSLGLVLIWTRQMDTALLTTVICITLYFIIGSLMEERKLIVYHGEAYRLYKQRVPGLIPLPWKWISREEAKRLEQSAANPTPK